MSYTQGGGQSVAIKERGFLCTSVLEHSLSSWWSWRSSTSCVVPRRCRLMPSYRGANESTKGGILMPVRSSETRRFRSLLGQRRVSDVVMVAILSVALLAGLVGFAVHVLWIAAIVVLALGLGYVVANARQDRREAIDPHREDEERAA